MNDTFINTCRQTNRLNDFFRSLLICLETPTEENALKSIELAEKIYHDYYEFKNVRQLLQNLQKGDRDEWLFFLDYINEEREFYKKFKKISPYANSVIGEIWGNGRFEIFQGSDIVNAVSCKIKNGIPDKQKICVAIHLSEFDFFLKK